MLCIRRDIDSANPSVTPSNCGIVSIVNDAHIVIFFPPTVRDMTLVFLQALPPLQNSKGTPSAQGRQIHGVRKFCDNRLKSPFVSATVRYLGPWLLRIAPETPESAQNAEATARGASPLTLYEAR